MIEGERNDDAVFMISELAKLFRISLSKGRTIISIKDELQHAQSYMNIQKIRYKNSFSITFDIEPEVYSYCTVKLVLQPILENAVNYGINDMDECGEITVSGKRKMEILSCQFQTMVLACPKKRYCFCSQIATIYTNMVQEWGL